MSMDAKWYAEWVRLLPASTADEKMRNLEAADMLEELDKRVPRWISVEERLPEYPCIVYDGINAPYVPQSIVRFPDKAGGTKCYPDVGIEAVLRKELPRYHRPAVTHWMPLPEPPEEDEHGKEEL